MTLQDVRTADAGADGQETEARRRVAVLADPGSFQESGSGARHRSTAFGMAARRPAGDGVVTGTARVSGRRIGLFSQDVRALGGSLGETHAAKIIRVLDDAERSRTPVIGLLDSGGARIQEGVGSLDGYARIFRRNVALSGRIPQISVVLGSCAGGAVYSPALTDIVIMARDARMFLTGPAVVRAVMHEEVGPEDLGGPAVHSRESGVAHLIGADTDEAIRLAGSVLSYLPDSCWSQAPQAPPDDPEPMPVVPVNHRKPYDIRTVIANQPSHLAGTLDIHSAEKGARFVRMCDAYGLPLVVLVDTPGFLPGTAQERGGIIRKGAKLLYAFAEAAVPRVTVVLRKAFGGAYIVMNSRALGADAVFAWPGAELAVMGAEGAVDVVWRRELASGPGRRDELIARYREQAMAAHLAAERLSVDEIIEPYQTRAVVAAALDARRGALTPRFRHDNLPQ
jgi:acetyl-CoA carboxylase carboxyltransferase component